MPGPNYHAWTHRPKAAGGTDPIESLALWPVKVFRDDIEVATTPSFTYKVPQDLDGHTLMRVEGFVAETGSSDTEVQLVRNPNGAADDMLTSLLTIGSGDLNDDGSAVVDPTFADVAFEDHIRVVVETAGSGATGLGVYMYFSSGPDVVTAVTGPQGPTGPTGPQGDPGDEGPQGDPGGIVNWTGEWDSGTTYSADDAVSWNGASYVAIAGSTNVEPGVDAGWETSWMLLAEGSPTSGIDGWTTDAATWTYASTSTFTVTGDRTADFSKGTRLKWTQTTAKYGVVVGSSYSSGTTTVTIAVNTDYTIANAAITAPYYSYQANPQGYPGFFNYTPTWASTGTAPAIGNGTLAGRFAVVGRQVEAMLTWTAGSTTTYGTGVYFFSVPITSHASARVFGSAYAENSAISPYQFLPVLASADFLKWQLPDNPAVDVAQTYPFTWGTADTIYGGLSYEMA